SPRPRREPRRDDSRSRRWSTPERPRTDGTRPSVRGPDRSTLPGDRALSTQLPVWNICWSSAFGTSDVPDTTGLGRFGSQSSAVTWRITWGTVMTPGTSAPLTCSMAAVTPVLDWKLPPAEYQMLYVGS